MNIDTRKNARLWTEAAGWAYVASGLALAGLSLSPAALQLVNALAVPEASLSDRMVQVYAGVAGGLTTGFGAAIIGIARATSAQAGTRAMALGVASWFLVDTSASLAHGSWQNALGNLVFLAIGLPPLCALGWALGASAGTAPLPDVPRTA